MSVFFTVVSNDRITMLSDSQGTKQEDGSIVHNAQKIWIMNSNILVSIGGDSSIGQLILKVAKETIEELSGSSLEQWVESIHNTCAELRRFFRSEVIQDYVVLFQVAGVSLIGQLQLFQTVATPEWEHTQPVHVDQSFPVHIVPPLDVPYNDCVEILKSLSRQLFPHTDHLTEQQWIEVARHAVEEVATLSQFVDHNCQQLTVSLKDSDCTDNHAHEEWRCRL